MIRDLHERQRRTEAVLSGLRDKPFSWETRANCIHLARAQLAAFGHAPPPVPVFRTALGAKRALTKRGFPSVGALMDSLLPAIPPAMAWIGDLVLLDSEGPLDALAIVAGGGMVLGWSAEAPGAMRAVAIGAADPKGAWRV